MTKQDNYYHVYSGGVQVGAYTMEENAYHQGWALFNAGHKDVYLTTPEGWVYTFSKHPKDNPNTILPPNPPISPPPTPTPPLTPTPLSQKHAIMGVSLVSAEKMVLFVRRVNPSFDSSMASLFIQVAAKYGVRGDIAFCQSIHETNWFRFGGDVKPSQNNFAGIGATGGISGATFHTAEEGISAQIQHLFAYATLTPTIPSGLLVDPRFHLVSRGTAFYWEDLAGKWAIPGYDRIKYSSFEAAYQAGATYGQQIIQVYQQLLSVQA